MSPASRSLGHSPMRQPDAAEAAPLGEKAVLRHVSAREDESDRVMKCVAKPRRVKKRLVMKMPYDRRLLDVTIPFPQQ